MPPLHRACFTCTRHSLRLTCVCSPMCDVSVHVMKGQQNKVSSPMARQPDWCSWLAEVHRVCSMGSSDCRYVAHLCDCPVRICSYPVSASFTKECLRDTTSLDQLQRSYGNNILQQLRGLYVAGIIQTGAAGCSCRVCNDTRCRVGNNSQALYYSLGLL